MMQAAHGQQSRNREPFRPTGDGPVKMRMLALFDQIVRLGTAIIAASFAPFSGQR